MNHFEKIKGLTYVTLSGMQEAARNASECVKTIRQWLPVKGHETLSIEQTIDRWHEVACRQCFEFFKFHPRLGCYATSGPLGSAESWRELCDGMADIRSHYNWESVDFESKLPHSDVRGGKKLKPILSRLLDRVEQAASMLKQDYSIHDTSSYVELDKHRVRELYGKASGRTPYGETWLRNRLNRVPVGIPCCDVGHKTLRLCEKELARLLDAEAIYDKRIRK